MRLAGRDAALGDIFVEQGSQSRQVLGMMCMQVRLVVNIGREVGQLVLGKGLVIKVAVDELASEGGSGVVIELAVDQ